MTSDEIDILRELINAETAAIWLRFKGRPDAAVAQQRLAEELASKLAGPEQSAS